MNIVSEIMTKNPVCCTPEMGIEEVAQLMLQFDCGEIPVVFSHAERKILGVVTDRDIVIRSIAQGLNPLSMNAEECMTYPPIVVKSTTSVEDCCQIMEDNQIRRVPVVDERENCCGMVSLSDIARKLQDHFALDLVKHVSIPQNVTPH
jgi:CBS domain-containing protein